MAFVSIDQGDQVTLATETGTDGTLADKTACLTDDTTGSSCVEVKSGAGIRSEINLAALDTAATNTFRIGTNSIMSAGTLQIAPYTAATTIDNTNGVTSASISGSGDTDVVLTSAFIGDLADLGGFIAIRLFENGSGAKIKVGEIDVEFTEITGTLTATYKDDAGTGTSGVEFIAYKVTGTNPMTLATTAAASGTTGALGAISETVTPADYVILYRDHNATEADAAVDMSHIVTVAAD
jgi:hypothetical protein